LPISAIGKSLKFLQVSFVNHKNSGTLEVKINCRKMKFGIMAGDQRYLKFFWLLIIQALLESTSYRQIGIV
jgi:hypothetical protein